MELIRPKIFASTILFVFSIFFFYISLSPATVAAQANTSCPLNITVLDKFTDAAKSSASSSPAVRCQATLSAIHLLQAEYLHSAAALFVPPLSSAEACWVALQPWLQQLYGAFDPRRDCGFRTDWISRGCMNISSRAEFEHAVPSAALATARNRCAESLSNGGPCAACTTVLNSVKARYLRGKDAEGNNVTDCSYYSAIYAAGVINPFGPSDWGTADCLFSLQTTSGNSSTYDAASRRSGKGSVPRWIYGVVAAAVLAAVAAAWVVVWRRRKRKCKEDAIRKGPHQLRPDGSRGLDLESSIAAQRHTTLVRYTLDEIKAATNNFSHHNIIGKGGYGNVYRGVLPGGAEVAVKRFKNCSAAGDAGFAHELEVIASVRHVNLVALQGYCIATTHNEGHQRIIVCDLVRNGSLYDHLFGGDGHRGRLSWPARRKIAVGMARGLCYLHCGAQPGIIHRDVKASNILLDEGFEAKVADFGLAKFAPEGASHVSTRVAGTLGYVSPEYALYGKLTEKSDVYSFGVVLLELLSGKKAVVPARGGGDDHDRASLVTDWAWELVRQGKVMEVVEPNLEGLEAEQVVERFVLVAVLCSHPLLHARPTMDQALKMLEADMPVPAVPDRPISIISDAETIERSLGSDGSGSQPFSLRASNSN